MFTQWNLASILKWIIRIQKLTKICFKGDYGMQSNMGSVTGTQSVIMANTQWRWKTCAFVNLRSIWEETQQYLPTQTAVMILPLYIWSELNSEVTDIWPLHTHTRLLQLTHSTHTYTIKAGTHSTLAFAPELSNTGGEHHQWIELPYMWGILQCQHFPFQSLQLNKCGDNIRLCPT